MTEDTEQVLIALSTCPSQDIAQKIAQSLVEKHLVACVNIVPNVQSVYRWQGEVQSDNEVLMVMKTTRYQFDALQNSLTELHPYELPELIGVSVSAGLNAYLEWVQKETGISR